MLLVYDNALFYERLCKLCKDRHTSVSRFTIHVLGLSSGTASQWKNGAIPSAHVIANIASYFNVSSDYLLGLTQNPTRSDAYDCNNLEQLYNDLAMRLKADDQQAEILICRLFQCYLNRHLEKTPNERELPPDSVQSETDME